MAATWVSRTQLLDGERRVLEVLENATKDLKLDEVATLSGVSIHTACTYLRRLRGKGKIVRFRGAGHDVFYKRKRVS